MKSIGINHLGERVLFLTERMKPQMNLHNYDFWSALAIDWSRKRGDAEVLCFLLFPLASSFWRKVTVSAVILQELIRLEGIAKAMCSRLNPSILHLPFLLIDSRTVKKRARYGVTQSCQKWHSLYEQIQLLVLGTFDMEKSCTSKVGDSRVGNLGTSVLDF